ncbi:MAG: hypothetical protein MUE82_11460 [Chloroflexi bacterium]|nr:hypothetical protein [Chloroflexota bacterium]
MWTRAFAAGLLLRPVLIVPMAPSGPLGGSNLLPAALAAVFVLSAVLAAGVLSRIRPATALGIVTAVGGVVIAAAGAWAGLPGPWPLLLVAYNGALAVAGIRAWRESRATTGA